MSIFQNKTIEEKMNLVLGESDPHATDDVEWDKVRDALKDAAKDIFDEEPDKEWIDKIVKNLGKHRCNDTENCIQHGINMMRGSE